MKDEIALGVGTFSQNAGYVVEVYQRNQTTRQQLHFVIDPYNKAVDSFIPREPLYRAEIQRCWGNALALYNSYFGDVHAVDDALHAFNDENNKVETGAEPKEDPERIRPLTATAAEAVSRLRESGPALLDALSNSEGTQK